MLLCFHCRASCCFMLTLPQPSKIMLNVLDERRRFTFWHINTENFLVACLIQVWIWFGFTIKTGPNWNGKKKRIHWRAKKEEERKRDIYKERGSKSEKIDRNLTNYLSGHYFLLLLFVLRGNQQASPHSPLASDNIPAIIQGKCRVQRMERKLFAKHWALTLALQQFVFSFCTYLYFYW